MPEHVYETDVPPEGFWEEQKIRSRFGRIVFSIALLGAITSFLISAFETFRAIRGPLSPNYARGLVIPFNNHGVIHYISQTHSAWLETSFALYFPFFITLIGIGVSAKLRASSRAKTPPSP